MEYKGFTYTPTPKTAWDNLSMLEKSEMMKVAVRNGITDLKTIKEKYNEFAEGGDTNSGMTGMMKAKLATAAHFGNPTARRMTNYDTRSLTWPEEYEYDRGIGEPKRGNVFVGSYDNLMATFALNSRHWKHGLGGNLFSGEEEGSQQMDRANIFRRPNGEYFYQASPESEEVTVTPLNTLFDNPALWTYTDANDKVYSPRQTAAHSQGTIVRKEDEGPLVEAAKNYLGELQYDINNGIPIGGKYTIPAIAASALLPLAGEAFAGTSIAGISAPTWTEAALTAGFGAHGLNHAINEGINGWGDAAMTALEVAPLGRLAKPIYEGVVQPGIRLFNSPLTGNWTRIGSREYRLNPNTLGANGVPLEVRSTVPQITDENAASITPEQWTAAQDAAIARGDMAEAQRLRDLHFKVNAPNTKITAISYRGSNTKNPVLRERVVDPDVGEMNGIYSSFDKKYASKYGNVEGLYINSENPLVTRGNWTGVINDAVKDKILRSGYDAVVNTDFDKAGKFLDFLRGGKRTENILFSGKKAKSAAPITYDDAGNIIPLGERDNFNMNDIRYGLIPFGIGLTGYGLFNNQEAYEGKTRKDKK